MDKKLDLVKILENAPVGTELYSVMHGKVKIQRVEKQGDYNIVVMDEGIAFHSYTKEGKFKAGDLGECLLYPSKECRDWNEFKVDLLEGTPVMASDDKKNWRLRFYYRDKRTYNAGYKYGDTTPWGYIVPVDKFDCNNLTFDIKDNYGMAIR